MILGHRWFVLGVSLVAHLTLIWFGLNTVATPMGDIIYAYQPWFENMRVTNVLLGINEKWVYPLLALPAILIPGWLGDATGFDYQLSWLAISVVVDLIALLCLLGWRVKPSPARVASGYTWIALQFMLGPVAISRLDNLSVAIAVIALASLLNERERLAAVWLTVAVWIKIWPVALLLGFTSGSKKLWRIPAVAMVSSLGILAVGWLVGGNRQLFSFLTAQTDRGIQVEAPIALIWLWQQVLGVADTGAYFSRTYLTFQVKGEGVDLVSNLMSYAMLIAVSITIVLAWFARRAALASSQPRENSQQVLGYVALTGILDLIVFNKVGSPQYLAWLILPVLIAVAYKLQGWRLPVIGIAVLMPLTWLIYPVFYDQMLAGEWFAVLLVTIRNLLFIALLVLANMRLTRLALK